MMFNIILVCTANICRSPAAQAFLAHALEGRSVRIDSAGTHANDGDAVDPTVDRLMIERGFVGLNEHRSRVLLPHHLSEYDLILCMERRHIDQLRLINPISVGKSLKLSHWDLRQDVEDPFGRSTDTYISSLNEIQKLCQQWASKMISMGLVE